MNYIKAFYKIVWFKLSFLVTVSVLLLILIANLINTIIIKPFQIDVRNSKQGVSRYEVELKRLENEVSSIQNKITTKSSNSKGMYDHYYSLYSNPVRYINKFVLSDAKPDSLLIITSSVVPNITFSSKDRESFKPFLREFGITNARSLPKLFKVFGVTISATGSFPVIGQYISNLNALPLKFSITSFDLKETNNALILNLKMSFFVYNLDSN